MTQRGEAADDPVGEPEQPHLLGRRRLDGEPVGVAGAALLLDDLVGLSRRARSRPTSRSDASTPTPRRPAAAPTTGSRTAATPARHRRRTSRSRRRCSASRRSCSDRSSPRSKSRALASSSARSGCSRCASPGGPTHACSKRSCSHDDPTAPRLADNASWTGPSACIAMNVTPMTGERHGQRVTVLDRGDQHAHRDRERRRAAGRGRRRAPTTRSSVEDSPAYSAPPSRHSADRRRRFNRGPPRARASSRRTSSGRRRSNSDTARSSRDRAERSSGYQPIRIFSCQRSRTGVVAFDLGDRPWRRGSTAT